MDVGGILPGEVALCKTEVMNSIQQVGLSHTVSSADTGNAFIEPELLLEIIFKLEQ